MTAAVVMGVRQLFAEKHFDTKIPFITGNLLIAFNVLSLDSSTIDPATALLSILLHSLLQS